VERVRRAVFIGEQGISEADEWDDADPHCLHALILTTKRDAVGTGRLEATGKIGRLAVLAEFRGRGLGGELLEWLVEQARRKGMESVYLHAQVQALEFYLHHGFSPQGPIFDEVGIPHQRMSRQLTP
jgi:predicted GNAT family N-acyltransferase